MSAATAGQAPLHHGLSNQYRTPARGRLITTGDQHYAYEFNPGMTNERHLYWTSDTQLTMMSQAPEPHTWAMLAAGLLGLTWRARRRR